MGSFTLVDAEMVSAADTGNNFFVTVDDIGKPRASVPREEYFREWKAFYKEILSTKSTKFYSATTV